jgi:hypothetical protein
MSSFSLFLILFHFFSFGLFIYCHSSSSDNEMETRVCTSLSSIMGSKNCSTFSNRNHKSVESKKLKVSAGQGPKF